MKQGWEDGCRYMGSGTLSPGSLSGKFAKVKHSQASGPEWPLS